MAGIGRLADHFRIEFPSVRDRDAQMVGVFLSSDYEKSTYDVDLAYVDGSAETGGDGLYLGLAQTRGGARVSW